MLTAVAVLAAALSALAFFGQLSWIVDLLAQFRLQALFGSIVLLLLSVMLRAWRVASMALAAIGLNGYALLSVPVAASADYAPTITVMSFNLLGDNRRIDDLVAWLRERQFDVVAFEELTPSFSAQLETLGDVYPHRLVLPRNGGFGIGIISRRPLLQRGVLFPAGPAFPMLRVSVDGDGKEIEIVVLHPPPPLNAPMANAHRQILQGVIDLPPNPYRVVLGDFNSAPTALSLRRLMRLQNLAGESVVPLPTWPTHYPWLLRIPIDHVFVGKGLALASVGTPVDSNAHPVNFGSDHFPQLAEICLAP